MPSKADFGKLVQQVGLEGMLLRFIRVRHRSKRWHAKVRQRMSQLKPKINLITDNPIVFERIIHVPTFMVAEKCGKCG